MRRLCAFVVIIFTCSVFCLEVFAAEKPVAKKKGWFDRSSDSAPAKAVDSKAVAKKSPEVKAAVVSPKATVSQPASAKAKAPAVKSVPAPQTDNVKEKAAQVSSMTKQEMISDIVDTLEDKDEILNLVDGLKKETIKGKAVYSFQGVNIENLEKDKLEGLLNKIRQQKVRINTENINRQLDMVRRVEQINNTARVNVPRVAGNIPSVPRAPSAVPSVARPPQVPQTPRVPSVPTPPRR